MRVFASLVFLALALAFGLPIAAGAVFGFAAGWICGREAQRILHSRHVYKGHPR